MSWNPRRKGWMKRGAEPARIQTPAIRIVVPSYPCFSPASIADLLHKNRSTVAYWMAKGKLAYFRDNVGAPYVLREELLRFIQEYLTT
ncbi:hypothetical protein [Nitrospira sp. Nam74]